MLPDRQPQSRNDGRRFEQIQRHTESYPPAGPRGRVRPGIGKLIYESVLTRNYPIVMGSVFITTILFVGSTMISDIINAGLDPRIRENL